MILLGSGMYARSQEFNGGVMAGLVGSQVAGDTYSGFNKAGVFAGGYVNYQFTKHSVLQMELEFFQKGARKNPKPEENDYNSHLFRANYVELPILYQYLVNERIRLETGPSFGFLISHYEETDEEVLSDDPGYNKPAALTVQFNLGIYVYLLDNLAFNFRTNNSVFNIRQENRDGDVFRLWGYGQFNDSLILSLFYTFRKKQ